MHRWGSAIQMLEGARRHEARVGHLGRQGRAITQPAVGGPGPPCGLALPLQLLPAIHLSIINHSDPLREGLETAKGGDGEREIGEEKERGRQRERERDFRISNSSLREDKAQVQAATFRRGESRAQRRHYTLLKVIQPIYSIC